MNSAYSVGYELTNFPGIVKLLWNELGQVLGLEPHIAKDVIANYLAENSCFVIQVLPKEAMVVLGPSVNSVFSLVLSYLVEHRL